MRKLRRSRQRQPCLYLVGGIDDFGELGHTDEHDHQILSETCSEIGSATAVPRPGFCDFPCVQCLLCSNGAQAANSAAIDRPGNGLAAIADVVQQRSVIVLAILLVGLALQIVAVLVNVVGSVDTHASISSA